MARIRVRSPTNSRRALGWDAVFTRKDSPSSAIIPLAASITFYGAAQQNKRPFASNRGIRNATKSGSRRLSTRTEPPAPDER